MCGSMVDIQCATAEIRRGKKEDRRKKEETTGQKYNGLPYCIGRPQNANDCTRCCVRAKRDNLITRQHPLTALNLLDVSSVLPLTCDGLSHL